MKIISSFFTSVALEFSVKVLWFYNWSEWADERTSERASDWLTDSLMWKILCRLVCGITTTHDPRSRGMVTGRRVLLCYVSYVTKKKFWNVFRNAISSWHLSPDVCRCKGCLFLFRWHVAGLVMRIIPNQSFVALIIKAFIKALLGKYFVIYESSCAKIFCAV